jgi:flavin reductase (DIM6/NTAB) family NADH-FMN oxidoreductase RutF
VNNQATIRVPGPAHVDPVAARQALRTVASTVYVVATRDRDAGFFATTATAVSSVCLDPPTLAVCLNRNGAIAERLREGTLFSVSALTRDQIGIARECAGGIPHHAREKHFEPAAATGAPVVAGAQAAFVCRCSDTIVRGTHLMVFGSIVDVVSRQSIEPLLYLDAQYGGFSATTISETDR